MMWKVYNHQWVCPSTCLPMADHWLRIGIFTEVHTGCGFNEKNLTIETFHSELIIANDISCLFTPVALSCSLFITCNLSGQTLWTESPSVKSLSAIQKCYRNIYFCYLQIAGMFTVHANSFTLRFDFHSLHLYHSDRCCFVETTLDGVKRTKKMRQVD